MRLSPKQRQALEAIAARTVLPTLVREEDGWHARWCLARAEDGDNPWVDEYVRAAAVIPTTAHAEDLRHETLHDAWISALRSRTGLVRWDEEECAAFARELEAWVEPVLADTAVRAGIVFTLSSSKRGFALSCPVPHGRAAYRALGQATFVWGPIRNLRLNDKGTGLTAELAPDEALTFLHGGAQDLVKSGYGVAGAEIDAGVELGVDIADAPVAKPEREAEVKLVVRVAGEVATAEEIRFLLEQGSSLVFFHNHWIEVDRNLLRMALRALEKSAPKSLSRNQILAFACGLGHVGRLEVAPLAARGWVRGLLNSLKSAHAQGSATDKPPTSAVPAIPGFVGELRAYQQRGVGWLKFMTEAGFGALLADDMGLGKTVQVIAWLLATHQRGRPALIVAPLTLLANWAHEFAQFAPGLKVYVHQGNKRHVASGFRRVAEEVDAVITSYNLLVKDHRFFTDIAWEALILDEAQVVRNADTQVARAVRALRPARRMALTGTPIENSVADIWSLEEFLNPGLLGERTDFRDRFVKPLALNPASSVGPRLRHALEPFVLRRLKTEPSIALELGEKREINDYCWLEPSQRAEYEAALADYRAGARRPGDVFALLTTLKQICDGAGKLARLTELLESIFAAGEKALVFTQYAKVGKRLQETLAAHFARPVPFLHGALSAGAREREIAQFKDAGEPTAFVLSLKAGGFGLNLTEATHVIHFDRWWNPAVENQATDRAHRLGQTQTVFVHRLITTGTVEEHVDDILRRKGRLAEGLLAAGEGFLMQLPREVLDSLVRLEEER